MILQVYYDFSAPQKEIKAKADIDGILKKLKKVSFGKLKKSYLEQTKSTTKKYKPMLQNGTYFKLHRSHFFKYIAGDVRIKNLMAKDDFYKSVLNNGDENYYWLIDEKVLYKLLELQQILEGKGFNSKAFHVRNGHRHPAYNERIGGASKSRHVKGEAIDIDIGDIDQNGQATQNDKQIILDLLENQIIKSSGGIGRYPGTMSVHFDVRGHRARWESV